MSKSQPEIGWWTTICCEEDLRQIENTDDLAKCLEGTEEDGRSFWPTKESALAELKNVQLPAERPK